MPDDKYTSSLPLSYWANDLRVARLCNYPKNEVALAERAYKKARKNASIEELEAHDSKNYPRSN